MRINKVVSISTALVLALAVVPVNAQVKGFVDNPTGNSTDWRDEVAGLGGKVNENINFNAHELGTLDNEFYFESDGVTFATSGPINQVKFGAGPGQGNVTSPPLSDGEGVHPASNYLHATAGPSKLTLTFEKPVLGAGLFIIDFFSPARANTIFISAYTGPEGTGDLLGKFESVRFNFQKNKMYFMGVTSSDKDIGSVVFDITGGQGDVIGIDDILTTGGSGGCDPCDANCDGSVDLTDVEPFIELLFGADPCNFCTGDVNDDGSIDLTDVEGFLACLLG